MPELQTPLPLFKSAAWPSFWGLMEAFHWPTFTPITVSSTKVSAGLNPVEIPRQSKPWGLLAGFWMFCVHAL